MKKKLSIIVKLDDLKIRIPTAKSGFDFKDKKKYNRKAKHKKNNGPDEGSFLIF